MAAPVSPPGLGIASPAGASPTQELSPEDRARIQAEQAAALERDRAKAMAIKVEEEDADLETPRGDPAKRIAVAHPHFTDTERKFEVRVTMLENAISAQQQAHDRVNTRIDEMSNTMSTV
eukprot:15468197-Alexandrium_andersonii.AAC.1